MRIRECSDGKILIHCFAGCGVDSILAAVGLEMDVLFPETRKDGKREKSPFSHREALNALAFEVTFLAACSSELRKGNKLSDKDHARLVTCASRLISAADYCSGRKS